MLRLENLNVFLGKAHILRDVSLRAERGEIVSFVGANGAGKSTLINTVSRLVRQKSGSVFFENECLDRVRYDQVVRKGLVQVPEGRKIFPSLTVLENLHMGAQSKSARRVYLPKPLRTFSGYSPVLKSVRRRLPEL